MSSRYKKNEDCAVESLVAHLRQGEGPKVVIMECRAADGPQDIFKNALAKLGKKTFVCSDIAFKDSIWESLRAAVQHLAPPENWTVFSGGFKTLAMEQMRSHGFDALGFFMCDTWKKFQWEELHQLLRRCIRQNAPVVVVLASERPDHKVYQEIKTLRVASGSMKVPYLDVDDVQMLFKRHAPRLASAYSDETILDLVMHVSNKSVQGVIHLAAQLEKQPENSREIIIRQLELQLPSSSNIDGRRESKY